MVSQFIHDPKEKHLQVIYRIFHYLKATPKKEILFQKRKELTLKAYTDAEYVGSQMDRRSMSDYFTFLRGNLVTWRNKKQNVVARSSAEAEFRAIAHEICELLWLRIILNDLRIKREGTMRLYCDNKFAINITHNFIQHNRTKHIETDRHFIKEKLESGLISILYMLLDSQLANILTKGLPITRFQKITSKLGIEDIYSSA